MFVDDIPNYNEPSEAVKFQRVKIDGTALFNEESDAARKVIMDCVALRRKYLSFQVQHENGENWGGLNRNEYIKIFKRRKEKERKLAKVANAVDDISLKELLRRRPDIPYDPYTDKPLCFQIQRTQSHVNGVYFVNLQKKVQPQESAKQPKLAVQQPLIQFHFFHLRQSGRTWTLISAFTAMLPVTTR